MKVLKVIYLNFLLSSSLCPIKTAFISEVQYLSLTKVTKSICLLYSVSRIRRVTLLLNVFLLHWLILKILLHFCCLFSNYLTSWLKFFVDKIGTQNLNLPKIIDYFQIPTFTKPVLKFYTSYASFVMCKLIKDVKNTVLAKCIIRSNC